MTAGRKRATSRRRVGSYLGVLVVGLIIVGMLVAAFGVWYVFFRPAGPPAIGAGAPDIPAGALATPVPVTGGAATALPGPTASE